MGRTGILILTICSNRKVRGGERAYNEVMSICSTLPPQRTALTQKRKEVLELLKGSEVSRQKVLLRDLPYNVDLVAGPDFGGTATGTYLPAAGRYRGRFYSELGDSGLEALRASPHHVLIISGLYGLVLPDEPIQAYSCHLLDHPSIPTTWTNGGFLTGLLLAYTKRFEIKRVFDFTGQALYRDLVNWNRVRGSVDVLHAFGDQNGGPGVLPSLALLTQEFLGDSEDELLGLRAGKRIPLDYEEIALESRPSPPEGFPVETVFTDRVGQEDISVKPVVAPRPPDPAVPSEPLMAQLVESRDIIVTSGEHNTMFDQKVHRMSDLPREVRSIFETVSRVPDVLEVYLGRFGPQGSASEHLFSLTLLPPQEGMGRIFGKVRGPGKIGRWQEIEIRVTRGREVGTFLALDRLMSESSGS